MKKLLAISILAVAGVAGQFALCSVRPSAAPVFAESVIASLGSLRAIAAEIVWFRADRLQEEGRYVELAQLASTLTFLEPHTPEVWSYSAWNLAYNISVMMPTFEDRWRWVLSAIELLRDGGIRLNPRDPQLYCELAWLFELKLGADLDDASGLYREKWKEIVKDAKAKDDWLSLGMDPEKMRAIEKKYGMDDWTNPLLSAIYWADEGLKFAPDGNLKAFLGSIISQSKTLYNRKG
ncbi:MAG: hypothetical protein J6W80_01015 [Kiritimatiellae bacterium]|nr:hypothetical protein [Kiritimatiellia bacterium]